MLYIDFDDTNGIGTAFLEEVFGGYVRKYKKYNLDGMLEIKSDDDETLADNVKNYIRTAERQLLYRGGRGEYYENL